jgi:hypothetical protein
MKDAYYFSHDANAHNDPKMIELRLLCGWEGIGIYWAFIEVLRDIPNYKYPSSNILQSLEIRLSTAKATLTKWLEACVKVGLLQCDVDFIYSEAFSRRMFEVDERRDVLSESGRKGGLSQGRASFKPGSSSKGKESKGKESKLKERRLKERVGFTPPTLDEAIQFMGKASQANNFFDYYSSKGWTVGRSPMKDWQAAARRWIKNDYSERLPSSLSKAQQGVVQGLERLNERYNGTKPSVNESRPVQKSSVDVVSSVPKPTHRA